MPKSQFTPAYAAFVAAYLEVRGLERVHVLGHSFGGRIGLVLGADYAGRVDRLVLANSAGVPNPPTPVRPSSATTRGAPNGQTRTQVRQPTHLPESTLATIGPKCTES